MICDFWWRARRRGWLLGWPFSSPDDVTTNNDLRGLHGHDGKVAFAGPVFPLGRSATAEDSLQFGAISGCQAKLREQALRKVRFQSRDGDPAVAGLIERIERITAAKRAAGAGQACAVRLIKLARALEERNEFAPGLRPAREVEQQGQSRRHAA